MFRGNQTPDRWLHALNLARRDLCPRDVYTCLEVWDDGEIRQKCRYAKVTNECPEMINITQTGKQIGLRCVPSQSIDFILSDD